MLGKKIITLDFDGSDIRLLITKGDMVIRWASVSVPHEHMHQGLINKPQRMSTSLVRFLSTHKASNRGIITSVTGHRSISRLLSLPAIKPDLLEDAVRRKAKQEMPLSLEETYLSWQVMGREDSQLQIFTLAVPRLIIDSHVETLRAAKIKLGSMDIRPLALVRAVAESDAIIINLEEQSLSVIIVRNSIPTLIRSMPQTSDKDELESAIERLSLELSRTTQFFNESHRDSPLDEKTVVYATGALFDQEQTRKSLASSISFPVEVPMPPMRWPNDFPLSTYIVNLGLAMKRA